MKEMKELFMRVVVVAMLLAMLMPVAVLGDTEDTATGTFSNNNVPSITYVKLYNSGGSGEVTDMTPQTAYDVKVKVADADGLADLTTIVVKLWYDADGSTPTEGEFTAAAANTQSCVIITWTESGGSGSFAINPSSSTTWALGTGVTPANLSGDFEFKFTVGKVATETTGSANWQIAAKVTDDSSQTAFGYDTDTATNDMNWYGGIDVPTATADWGLVNPGMVFAEGSPSEEALGVNITYISNGAFDEMVKSSATWTGVPSGNATLSADAGNANEFALKADDSGTLSSAVVVDATGVNIDNTGILTEEAGHNAAANALWLALNATFTKAVYTGTITYIIADGS